jgi:nucleoside-diphosphate kinase
MMLQTNAPLRTRTPFGAARRCARPSARVARAVNVRAEISYIMIKPDGVQRGLVGDIISRFEKKGFQLKALKLYQTPKEVAEEHYKDLKEKPFYPALVGYIVSGPVVAMVR